MTRKEYKALLFSHVAKTLSLQTEDEILSAIGKAPELMNEGEHRRARQGIADVVLQCRRWGGLNQTL